MASDTDFIDNYDTVTTDFLDHVLARFPVMFPYDAKEFILNDGFFYSITTLLNELFLPPYTINDECHKRTILSIVIKLESRGTPTDQNSVLSTVWLHTLTAIYLLQTGSEVNARHHIIKAADRLFENAKFKMAYFGILRVCFEYEIELPEDLATRKIHRGILSNDIHSWIYDHSRHKDHSYNIRRSIWISTLVQGKTEFRKDIARLKNGELDLAEINAEMHSWLQRESFEECPFPEFWDYYGIDQLSAIDAELKFLQPIYDVAMSLARGISTTVAGSTDNLTSVKRIDSKAPTESIDYYISIIGNFTKKSINYVKAKQELLAVDRNCGFQKECNYLNHILQSFSVIGSAKFRTITKLNSYELSSMVEKTWKYGKKSTPPNFSSTLAMERWNGIYEEELELHRRGEDCYRMEFQH
ncbi:hypothetical protein M441DRAFT_43970 [Trichoderma asperellum CBS 433.97]|uniref:Uncharacterized protein n=1 Tax=Trichoderma asperellum (strain ATCC 204424 / CBS 433.97 / NBRC 101777) TaxID=1042311 RepID=A0A2T3ZGA2_TRIA4|nr:hypothetical protein M441DRAFT_43970 [Trichoderma asperellum CBS 433.97]PTB43837.1 hypothetical protein M441DRAFT_43970 [Trichoderma asperellum CBS 433.97]